MNQKYVDKSGEVRAARELLSMSVEALAGAAQIDPRFVQLVEAKQAVTDGPALHNLFDALERCGQERILQIQSMVPAMARRADEARARERARQADVAAAPKVSPAAAQG